MSDTKKDILSIAKELLELESKATPGPWAIEGYDDDGKGQFLIQAKTAVGCDEEDNEHGTVGFQMSDASYGYAHNYHDNPQLIVAARNHIRALCEALIEANVALIKIAKWEQETVGGRIPAKPGTELREGIDWLKKWG